MYYNMRGFVEKQTGGGDSGVYYHSSILMDILSLYISQPFYVILTTLLQFRRAAW